MALSAEVVDLIRLHLLNDPDQVGDVGEVALVESEAWGLPLRTRIVRVLVKVIDSGGIETARAPLDAMHLVTLIQQQLCEVAAVLARDAGDQCGFGRGYGH